MNECLPSTISEGIIWSGAAIMLLAGFFIGNYRNKGIYICAMGGVIMVLGGIFWGIETGNFAR